MHPESIVEWYAMCSIVALNLPRRPLRCLIGADIGPLPPGVEVIAFRWLGACAEPTQPPVKARLRPECIPSQWGVMGHDPLTGFGVFPKPSPVYVPSPGGERGMSEAGGGEGHHLLFQARINRTSRAYRSQPP